MFSEPNPNNACYAQFSEEKRLFRTVSIEFADVPRKTQQEWCLSEDKYVYCPYYATKSKKDHSDLPSDHELVEPVMADTMEEADSGMRKTAFIAAGLVLAVVVLGSLLLLLKTKKATPKVDVDFSPTVGREIETTKPAPQPTRDTSASVVADIEPTMIPTSPPEPTSPPQPTPKSEPTTRPQLTPEPQPTSKSEPLASDSSSKDWTAMNNIVSLALEKQGNERLLQLQFDRTPMDVKPHYLKAHDGFPDRFYVDLHGICVPNRYQVSVLGHSATISSQIPMDDEMVSLLRIAQNQKDPLIARVTVYLKFPCRHKTVQNGPRITVHLSAD